MEKRPVSPDLGEYKDVDEDIAILNLESALERQNELEKLYVASIEDTKQARTRWTRILEQKALCNQK
jgi:hypothetical protein